MKYTLDLHTHTIASGHAYTTLLENAKYASEIGLKILGTTEHGPKMPHAPHIWYFYNYKVLPRKIYGVTMLHGCEVNVVDYEGNVDLPKDILKDLDIVIASLHEPCVTPGTIDENTQAILKVMDNPYVDIIGHPGNPAFPIHAEEIVKKAKEKNILIEINNSSFKTSRIGSIPNCTEIAKLCKKYGAKIILGSDSHVCFTIGNFDKVQQILDSIDMPQELIMNNDENKLITHLKNKGKLKDIDLH
ncbi:phosphatase [Clostridium botulinum C]|uniref:Phosphatase n=2 Tax=Clostridium botulinum TaxID=1491 RepID=A0A9Q4TGN0_CLOBO|nr:MULTISPECIES: phosphatase [Clostridium]EGO88755.1 hydrolase [Clostridium botulinum C str. Stockholm]KEI09746.1 hydrolase [Clostridium sp. K25]MCD3194686.1 phosphatase [Clostridium botulinum C]MCD3200079.1 phosphatase [Clostridium botulinum C]MCD3205554.1 phosphatase [Clostridium botulinum C]